MTSSFTGGLWSFRRAVSVSGADTVIQAVEEERHIFACECQTALPAPTADVMHGVQCITGHNQSASLTACLLLLPLLPPHSAPSLSPDKAQVIGRTVSGTNGLPASLGIYWNDHAMIFRAWSRQINYSLCNE